MNFLLHSPVSRSTIFFPTLFFASAKTVSCLVNSERTKQRRNIREANVRIRHETWARRSKNHQAPRVRWEHNARVTRYIEALLAMLCNLFGYQQSSSQARPVYKETSFSALVFGLYLCFVYSNLLSTCWTYLTPLYLNNLCNITMNSGEQDTHQRWRSRQHWRPVVGATTEFMTASGDDTCRRRPAYTRRGLNMYRTQYNSTRIWPRKLWHESCAKHWD